jgi:toxin ParE1/3/4
VPSPLLIEPEAEQELDDAARRYEAERPGLGHRFLDGVAATLDRIRRFPLAGAPVPYLAEDVPARRAPVKSFPYHVVYLTAAEGVRVLAFAHVRRRPGYWLGRSGS